MGDLTDGDFAVPKRTHNNPVSSQVTKPLIRWFQTKSRLCRELEVQAIRDFVAAEKGDTAEGRRKRLADDTAWMTVITASTPAATPPVSPPPQQQHVDEEEQVRIKIPG